MPLFKIFNLYQFGSPLFSFFRFVLDLTEVDQVIQRPPCSKVTGTELEMAAFDDNQIFIAAVPLQ